MSDRAMLTMKEVASLCSVSVMTVSRWAKTGRLPALRFGRTIRFRPEDVDRFLEDAEEARGRVS
jgi:excisionase family DNA binding protein